MSWVKKILISLAVSLFLVLFFLPFNELFLKHADFAFPLEAARFVERHVYLWSSPSGSIGVDSTIRFFARLPFLLMFGVYRNNLAFSYSFILYNLLVIYAGGYAFARWFLEVGERYWRHLLALFLVFNPVFLGNFSKLGLLFAVGVLLLLMTATKRLFATSTRHAYWFYAGVIILLLNFSFVHPFNFLGNLFVFVCVFAYYAYRDTDWLWRRRRELLASVGLGLLSSLYIIVSILATGSLEKEVLSNSIGASAEEQFLLNIANNKSLLESATFFKSVFVEYEFFPENQRAMYLIGAALIYAALGILFYFRDKQRYTRVKMPVILSSVLFMLLLVVTTGSLFLPVETVYVFLYETIPGGWAFRSPLKFQLYVPIVLMVLFGLLLPVVKSANFRIKRIAAVVLGLGMLLSSGYLLTQVYDSLLTPKSFAESSLAALDYEEFRGRRVLYVNSEECRENKKLYPEEYTLLVHYFKSRENTFTVLNEDDYQNRGGLYASFDYIVRCKTSPLGVKDFQEHYLNKDYNYSIWRNTLSRPVSLTREVVQTKARFINSAEAEVLGKYGLRDYVYQGDMRELRDLDTDRLNTNTFFDVYDVVGEQVALAELALPEEGYFFNFNYPDLRYTYEEENLRIYTEGTVEVYPGEFAGEEIYNGPVPDTQVVVNQIPVPIQSGEHKLVNLDKPVELVVNGETFSLESQLQEINSQITPENNPFELSISDYYTLQINDPRLGFEEGLWRETVGDCFDYDDNPQIAMELNNEVVLEGESSMLLSARRHNACTNLSFPVEPEDVIDLTIPYYTPNPERFVYQLSFNDPAETLVDGVHYAEAISTWEEAVVTVPVPLGATEATLRLEVPEGRGEVNNQFFFDDLRLSQNPRLASRFFYSASSIGLQTPLDPELTYEKLSPVRTRFTLSAAPAGEYLLTWQENYHPGWALDGYEEAPHLRSRGLRNGWVVNIEDYCRITLQCTSLGDGTYDVTFEAYFSPQGPYQVGLIVSGLVFSLLILYLCYALYRRHY